MINERCTFERWGLDFERWGLDKVSASPHDLAIDIWQVALDQPRHAVAELRQALSSAERERCAALRSPTDRARRTVAYAALRQILAGAIHAPGASLQIVTGPTGKPRLTDFNGGEAIQFNLTHSADLCLIAVAYGAAIGIDVEAVVPRDAVESLIAFLAAPEETPALQNADDLLPTFYRLWTRKEAYVKATGAGLSMRLAEIAVESGRHAAFLKLPGDNPAAWSLIHLEPAPGYIGALAVRRPEAVASLRTWNPTL